MTRELAVLRPQQQASLRNLRRFVVIKVGTLDDPSLFGGPRIPIYTVDKQPFHHVPEGMPAFERLPVAAFQGRTAQKMMIKPAY